jgi:Immunity protein family (Imm11)
MASIYGLRVSEGVEWVLTEEGDWEAQERIVEFDGSRREGNWAPLRVHTIDTSEQGERLPKVDMPWMGGHALVLRGRALNALTDVLLPDVEFLPLISEDGEERFSVVNVLRVIDAIDDESSDLIRFRNSRKIMKARRLSFRADRIEGVNVFKTPDTLRSFVFFGQAVADRVREAGLTGARFELLWTDEGQSLPDEPGSST